MPVKVLMVCLGNICRSPLAEGILKEKSAGDAIVVDSAGTAGYHIGNPPDPRSIAIARKYGIDISEQRCRQFTPEDFEEFDHIFVMDRQNLADVAMLAQDRDQLSKVQLVLQNVRDTPDEVPDPYHGGPDGFRRVYRLLDRACEQIAADLNS